MRTHRCTILFLVLLASSAASDGSLMLAQSTSTSATNSTNVVLRAADLESILPSSVFFSGQSATVQKRNSGGVRFAGGALMFVTKVDTGGYSSSVQEKYQDYLITEITLTIGSNKLPPGAYGVGFIANNKFLVMDIGGHDLFTVDAQRDDAMSRPTPLQVLPDAQPDSYRLYSGRAFVVFRGSSY